MLDNGYSLSKVEVFNWGNFHGLHTFQLREPQVFSPLLSPPPASAILGVNGSGKSTLIDALMITLLPFENMVKLGVTNDAEAGPGSGRTIRDYVLGKHSSNNSLTEHQLSDSHGRKNGCSMILLNFSHNRIANKFLTLGRLWWYQNQKVSDTQLSLLSYESLGITNLCPTGMTPKSPKVFRQHCKATLPHVQIFDTASSYFTSLSSHFGQISKDDLKVLNRAFYAKSIAQIDQFIRENMLLEQTNPNMERLLENVRSGQEIAYAIETCELKISAIDRILKSLHKIHALADQKQNLDQKERLLNLYQDWLDLKNNREKLTSLKIDVKQATELLPRLHQTVEEARRHYASIQSQLFTNDIDARLQKVSTEIEFLSKEIGRIENRLSSVSEKACKIEVKIPKRLDDWSSFCSSLEEKSQQALTLFTESSDRLEELRRDKFNLSREEGSLKENLEHISKYRTLIPKELYVIKEALLELKIPASHLFFVGELLQVKQDYSMSRRAIESVLFPISRNLLCHPDHLNALTKWLDGKGLKSDVTVKRISSEELDTEPIQRDNNEKVGSRILDMIEMLPEKFHPFTRYLWSWLYNTFDYTLVDLKAFRSDEGKLVTIEGLVKTDNRTMRKLKQHFQPSLGWDNSEFIAELTSQLLNLHERYQRLLKALEKEQATGSKYDEQRRFFSELNDFAQEIHLLKSGKERLSKLREEQTELLQENPDYEKLKQDEQSCSDQIKALQKKESTCENDIEEKSKIIKAIELLLPEKETQLTSSLLYSSLAHDLGDESKVNDSLVDLHETVKKSSRVAYADKLRQESQTLNQQMEKVRSNATEFLTIYKRDHEDPNLSYDLPTSLSLTKFVQEWESAQQRLLQTELPQAQEKWRRFFDQVLLDSVKDTINEIKAKVFEIEKSIQSINEVLKLTNFEDLLTEKRYLKIHIHASTDERIRDFKKCLNEVEKVLAPQIRMQIETQSQNVMGTLLPFVKKLQDDLSYRNFVTDVRNHFHFEVHSLRRSEEGQDELMEVFSGSRKDAKSSAQTTQLAYTLLASCLAFRFKFHDPVAGQETPRLLVLDEFGGKFDNEKPREILRLLEKMGFQSILVSPMSKGDLLAGHVSHLVFVHKVSATQSKVHSVQLSSKEEYDRMLMRAPSPESLN